MDFEMRYDRWYRPLAIAVGLGPRRTTIRLDGNTLTVKHGWAFRLDIPVHKIASVRTIEQRPFSWGVHVGGDLWMVNGSRDGIVEITMSRPVTSRSVKLMTNSWGEVRTLCLSLVNPDDFVTVLRSYI